MQENFICKEKEKEKKGEKYQNSKFITVSGKSFFP